MAMRKWTIRQIKNEVARLDPKLEPESDEFKAATVLLSATQVRTSVKALRKFTGLPGAFVSSVVARLRASGVFTRNGQLAVEWFDENGAFGFWLDVCVACGLMKRAKR